MRIKGKKIYKRAAEVLVFPRQDGDIVIKAGPVLDDGEFLRICPRPATYEKILPGGKRVVDTDNPTFKKNVTEWSKRKFNWMIIQSLKFTEGFEWETVDENDPDTWGNFESELTEAGFSELEQTMIVQAVTSACGLTPDKVHEATERFLAEQAAARDVESSPDIELHSTTSGEVASE